MSVLTCVAKIKAKPESKSLVKSELVKCIEPTRNEQGCLDYDMHVDINDSSIFVFYENWETEAHLDRHIESEHIRNCYGLIGDLLESVEVYRLSKV